MFTNINYSYYVDNIIRISPPYQLSGKNDLKKYDHTDEKLLNLNKRPRKRKSAKGLEKHFSVIEEAKDDQQLALDYYNLMPLEDKDLKTYTHDTGVDKTIGHELEILGDDFPKFYDNDEYRAYWKLVNKVG